MSPDVHQKKKGRHVKMRHVSTPARAARRRRRGESLTVAGAVAATATSASHARAVAASSGEHACGGSARGCGRPSPPPHHQLAGRRRRLRRCRTPEPSPLPPATTAAGSTTAAAGDGIADGHNTSAGLQEVAGIYTENRSTVLRASRRSRVHGPLRLLPAHRPRRVPAAAEPAARRLRAPELFDKFGIDGDDFSLDDSVYAPTIWRGSA